MKVKESLYHDSIYQNVIPYIEPNKKPLYNGIEPLNYNKVHEYMTINQKGNNSYYIMPCNESGLIIDIYAVINKRFKTLEKAEEYFNKYFKNVTLIYDNSK